MPADGRWQRGAVIRAFYLAASEDTAWSEWFRHTAEVGVPPARRLPRHTWRYRVGVDKVADLTEDGVLEAHGITGLFPTRRQWRLTQPIGEAYWSAGFRGLVAPSAAHVGGRVLAIYRPTASIPGVRATRPPKHYDELPQIPTGLRT